MESMTPWLWSIRDSFFIVKEELTEIKRDRYLSWVLLINGEGEAWSVVKGADLCVLCLCYSVQLWPLLQQHSYYSTGNTEQLF